MTGLRDALAQGQRTAADLTKTLTTKVTADIGPLTTALGQARAQVQAFTTEVPQLALEFDITEAQQGAFGFMRNLEEIQHGAQRVADAAAPVQRTWGQTLRASLQRVWDSAKTGTRDLVAGFRQATQGASATGAAGERAGHQGAAGFARFGAQVASTAKGFVLAQAGLGSVEQALQRLLGFFTQIRDEVSEDEQAAFQLARALIAGGQAAGRTWEQLTGLYDEQEKRLHSLSEQTGIATRNLSVFTTRAVEAGIPLEHAEQQVALIARGISGMMGPTERVNALTSEMRAIYSGTAEQVNWLKKRLGEAGIARLQELNTEKQYAAAEAFLRQELKITSAEIEARRKSINGVATAYRNMVDQMLSGEAGTRFAKELSTILESITKDLHAHGPLWQAVTTLINTGTEAVRSFKNALDDLARVTNRLSAPQAEMRQEWEAYKADVRAFLADPWAGVKRGAWSLWEDPFSTGRRPPPAPTPAETPTTPGTTPGTPGGEPIVDVKKTLGELAQAGAAQERITLQQLQALQDQVLTQENLVNWQVRGRIAQEAATAEAQHALELAQAQGDTLRAQAQLSGDAVQQAQAEAAAKRLVLAAQRELLQTQLAWNQANLLLIEGDKAKSPLEQESARQQVAQLQTALKGLGLQEQALALDTQRAAVQAQITLQAQRQESAAEALQAAGERGLAAMRAAAASELTVMQQEASLRDRALAAEQQQLQTRRDALAAAGALSQAERERLTTAITVLDIKRETNRVEATLAHLTTAAAQASAQLQAVDEARRLGLERQVDQEETRLELQHMYLRALDLPAAQEQLQLTLLQAQSRQRQSNLQLAETEAARRSAAIQYELDLVGKSAEQQRLITQQYENQLQALDNTSARLQQQQVILAETQRIAIALEQARPFKELAGDLVSAGQRFVDTVLSGTATMKDALKALVQDAAKSFLDAGLKPLWERLQKDLAGGLQRLITGTGPGAAALSPEAQALMSAGTTLDTAGSDLATATGQLESTSGELQLAAADLRAAAQAILTRPQAPAGLPTGGAAPLGATPTLTGLPPNLAPWADEVGAAARQLGVDPLLVLAVMQQESGGNPKATSRAGAKGLMQLMRGTAKDLGVTNPWDPQQNITGGTTYLAQLLARYNQDLVKALAAYNWGMGNVERQGLGAMPAETRQYVDAVMANYAKFQASAATVEPLVAPIEASLTRLTDQAGSGFERMTSDFLGANAQMATVTQGLQPTGPALSQAALDLQGAAAALKTGPTGRLGGFEPIETDVFGADLGEIGGLGEDVGTALSALATDASTSFERVTDTAARSFDRFTQAASDSVGSLTDDFLRMSEDIGGALSNLFQGGGGGGGGGWGNVIMGGIGLAMTALSSLMSDTSAKVESLGDAAKDQIESTEKTRGLIAGEATIPIAQLSGELSKAMRYTNEILLRIEQVLRGQGSAPAPVTVAGSGGSFGITIETMSGARV